jgi:hypothetical protein
VEVALGLEVVLVVEVLEVEGLEVEVLALGVVLDLEVGLVVGAVLGLEVPLVEVVLGLEVVLGVELHRIRWLSTKSERTCPGRRLEWYRCCTPSRWQGMRRILESRCTRPVRCYQWRNRQLEWLPHRIGIGTLVE